MEHDFPILDDRYVKRSDCATHQKNIDREISDLRKNDAVILTKLNIITGILSAIGVAVLGVAVKLLFT